MVDTPGDAATTRHDKYERLIEAAQKQSAIKVAVAHPCDESSMRGAAEAMRLRLIEPILVGPVERIRRAAAEVGFDIGGVEVVDAEHSHASAGKAVELVRAGNAEALMKGSLHTDELMGAVVSSTSGIRTDRQISHCFIMDVPGHPDPLIITERRSISPRISMRKSTLSRVRSIWRMRWALSRCAVAILKRDGDRDDEGPLHDRSRGPCARWRSAGRSPGRSSTGLSRSTTRSVRKRRRSRRSRPRLRGARTFSSFRTLRPATCWPRA